MSAVRMHTSGEDAGDPHTPMTQTLNQYAHDTRDAQTEGAVVLLLGLSLAICGSAVWGDFGGVTCKRRLTYSPDNRAFSIWGLIWLWFVVSNFAQLGGVALGWQDVRPSFVTNALMATSHALCAPWAYFFGHADSPHTDRGLFIAAIVLVSAATLAVTAVAEAGVMRGERSSAAVLLVGTPYALYAGWMCVAAALNLGIVALLPWPPARHIVAVAEAGAEAETATKALQECVAHRSSYSIFSAAPPGFESRVPLVIVSVVSVLALAIPSPILPLPALWATFNMYGTVYTRTAFVLAALASGCAGLLVAYDPLA